MYALTPYTISIVSFTLAYNESVTSEIQNDISLFLLSRSKSFSNCFLLSHSCCSALGTAMINPLTNSKIRIVSQKAVHLLPFCVAKMAECDFWLMTYSISDYYLT